LGTSVSVLEGGSGGRRSGFPGDGWRSIRRREWWKKKWLSRRWMEKVEMIEKK
nr:hypothetical protein [Tanacetum cinerariifolium]